MLALPRRIRKRHTGCIAALIVLYITGDHETSAAHSHRQHHIRARARIRLHLEGSGEQRHNESAAVLPHEPSEVEEDDSKPWPAIYVYQLPPVFTNTATFGLSLNYMADVALPEWLSRSRYVTDDPEEADLYLPLLYHYESLGAFSDDKVMNLWRRGPGGRQSQMLRGAYDIIRTEYPYWNRSGGCDHIWTLTQDHGFCGFAGNGEMMVDEIQPSIILSHWGLMREERVCVFDDIIRREPCEHFLDPRRRLPCFIPQKDTIIPHTVLDGFVPLAEEPRVTKLDPNRPRIHTVFLAASADFHAVYYSHGVRQGLFKLFHNQTGWKMVDMSAGQHTDTYLADFEESTFCMAVTGSGWGVRAKLAVLNGCIPVVISDQIQLELEDVLPWPEFALRLPQYMLYRLPEALQTLIDEPGKVAEMQRKVACVWRWFTWQEPYGRAGEGVICSLRRKLAGWDVLKPSIDWEKCELLCDVPPQLRRRQQRRRLALDYSETARGDVTE